jgi:hypothetical protein
VQLLTGLHVLHVFQCCLPASPLLRQLPLLLLLLQLLLLGYASVQQLLSHPLLLPLLLLHDGTNAIQATAPSSHTTTTTSSSSSTSSSSVSMQSNTGINFTSSSTGTSTVPVGCSSAWRSKGTSSRSSSERRRYWRTLLLLLCEAAW